MTAIERFIPWSAALLASIGWLAPTFAPQGSGPSILTRQQLNNCDLDIRPFGPRREAQVYWNETNSLYTTEFSVGAVADDHLEMADGQATDGSARKIKAGVKNVVSFTFAPATNRLTMTIKNDVDPDYSASVPFEGTFDKLGPVLPDLDVVYVRRELGTETKKRARITAQNFGMRFSFTISDV